MKLDAFKKLLEARQGGASPAPDDMPASRVSAARVAYKVLDGGAMLPPGSIAFCHTLAPPPMPGDVVVIQFVKALGREPQIGVYHPSRCGQAFELRRLDAPDAPGEIFTGKQYRAILLVDDIARTTLFDPSPPPIEFSCKPKRKKRIPKPATDHLSG